MNDFEQPEEYWSWHQQHGYSRFINVSGTMTGIGGSIVRPVVQRATIAAMGRFVKIHEMQTRASSVISELTGSEAGCVTASSGAAISLSIAACITGLDPAKVEALPDDTAGHPDVAIQLGHLCDYGAPISTAIKLAGAQVRQFGQSTLATDYQMEAALTENTVAALYVVSHHVVHYGQIPFERFVEIAHAKGVPVIVDAASEYDLISYIAGGADIVIYSGHKFLGGPTSGIIAGRRDLIRATYLQNIGIGRGMKIGKESIAGCISAMEEWMKRDHAAIFAEERTSLELWANAVSDLPGIEAETITDPTGNPLERLQINVNSEAAGASAASFARVLGEQEPAIIVRNHEVELNYFQLDPCNLTPGQAQIVADALLKVLSAGSAIEPLLDDYSVARNGGVEGYLRWLS